VWQVAQALLSDALLWNLAGVQAPKPDLWQAVAVGRGQWRPRTGTGMCCRAAAVGRRIAAGVAGRALAPTVTCVWFHLLGVQPVVEWQLKQLVLPTGMCVADLPVAGLPLWQLAQLVDAPYCAVVDLGVDDQVLVDLWQLSQLPVTFAWIGVFDGLPTADWNPPVWQLAQLLLS
jgi:hypothetical protein